MKKKKKNKGHSPVRGLGKQVRKLLQHCVIVLQREFGTKWFGNVKRAQLLPTRAVTRKGDASTAKREMDGFSPGRQG